MNIKIITCHDVYNYGASLQAYALQTYLKQKGHDVEIIDYLPAYMDKAYSLNFNRYMSIPKMSPLYKYKDNAFFRIVYAIKKYLPQLYKIVRQRGRKLAFDRFKHAYLHLTDHYVEYRDLKDVQWVADVFIVGSDQVWNPLFNNGRDPSYFLQFGSLETKRVAYAASFGHTEMTAELKQYYRKWLSRYEYIAVREDSAVTIIKEFGMDAYQVIDPTLLLDASFWNKYLSPIKIENYVLVYQLHNDEKLGRYAKRVADEMNLPLVRISASFHQITREGKFVWCPEMGQFLSYIKNATCMITDSFHGTAFAINFNTPFVEVLPNNNTGTRNMSILRMTGLSHRILRDEEDIQLAKNKVDFTEVNEVLKEKRIESLEILKKMIEE